MSAKQSESHEWAALHSDGYQASKTAFKSIKQAFIDRLTAQYGDQYVNFQRCGKAFLSFLADVLVPTGEATIGIPGISMDCLRNDDAMFAALCIRALRLVHRGKLVSFPRKLPYFFPVRLARAAHDACIRMATPGHVSEWQIDRQNAQWLIEKYNISNPDPHFALFRARTKNAWREAQLFRQGIYE